MADFPTLPHSVDSDITAEAGYLVDYTDGGSVRKRRMYTVPRYVFSLVLSPMTTAQKDSLLSHYGAHKDSAFNYTWPEGATAYSCLYTAHPKIRQGEAGSHWIAYVRLEGS